MPVHASLKLPDPRWLALLMLAWAMLAPGCGSPEGSKGGVEKSAYERGITALEMFDFQEAYLQLSQAYPDISRDDPRWLEATYACALASWHRPPPDPEKINQAVGLFRELLAAEIPDDWKARVRLSLARVYEVGDFPDDEIDLAAARELYQQVQKDHPTDEFGYQATLRLAQTYAQQLDEPFVREAIGLIQAQIERDPDSPWAAVAWQYIGDLYAMSLQDQAAALRAYLHTEQMGFPNESRSDVYLWRMAQWASELGRLEEAVRLWTRIVVEFPRSPYGTIARDYVRAYAKAHPEKNITPPELQTW